MFSQFLLLNVILLISSSFLHAQYRAHPKRPFPVSRKSSVPSSFSFDESLVYGSEDDSLKESSTIAPLNLANEQQTNQFMRLVYDRLNLKEPPNVTIHGNDGTGFPSAIVKHLEQQVDEQQRTHHMEELRAQQRQNNREDSQATIERAILPGDSIPSHNCQRQIGTKFNLHRETTQQIDCFRFSKLSDPKTLPTNQVIKELRIYVKKNYFSFHHEQENQFTPSMFHLYQVFRPTGNGSGHHPSSSLSDTTRLAISDVRLMSDNWFELTIDAQNNPISLELIYQQFITPWYGLAINHNLQSSTSHRRYYSKKHWEDYLRSNDEESNDFQQRLPYMLVEYGEKKSSSGRAPRGAYRPRPARPCDPKSPCCRRALIIDLDQGNTKTWDFVIYPRQIDIGECIGLCGTSGSSLKHTEVKNLLYNNEPHAANNFISIHQIMFRNRNATTTDVEQKSTHCCSYSRTGGLDIMYTIVNGGPIIRKYIPNMIVEQCRCGLPATIQQI